MAVGNRGIMDNAYDDVKCVHLCCQTREHQAVLCASGAILALASLLPLSAGNEKVSLLHCMFDVICLYYNAEQ